MDKYIPYEKLSKKKKRELDSKKRTDWGILNPISRVTDNAKIYNRKKARKWKEEESHTVPFTLLNASQTC